MREPASRVPRDARAAGAGHGRCVEAAPHVAGAASCWRRLGTDGEQAVHRRGFRALRGAASVLPEALGQHSNRGAHGRLPRLRARGGDGQVRCEAEDRVRPEGDRRVHRGALQPPPEGQTSPARQDADPRQPEARGRADRPLRHEEGEEREGAEPDRGRSRRRHRRRRGPERSGDQGSPGVAVQEAAAAERDGGLQRNTRSTWTR